MISEIKKRLTTGGVASVAVLSAVTLILVLAATTEPGPFALGNEAHYYSNLVGAFVGWIWMSVSLVIQISDGRENDPVLSAAIFGVGLALVFIFNTIVVGKFQPALILQVIGYILLTIDAMAMGFYVYYLDSEQRTEIAKA